MNPYRSTDLAKAYRADDIQAASDRRRGRTTIDATQFRSDRDPGGTSHPSRVNLTIRRFILRSV